MRTMLLFLLAIFVGTVAYVIIKVNHDSAPAIEKSNSEELPEPADSLALNSSNDRPINNISTDSDGEHLGFSDPESYSAFKGRLKKIRQRRPDTNITPEQLVQLLARPSAWEPMESPTDDLPLSEDKKTDGREFIKFDHAKLETLMIGDTLEIPLQQNARTYLMNVESIQVYDDGNITWSGSLALEGGYYHTTFTQSANNVIVGGINSPDGHFTVEARDDHGWVVLSLVDAKDNQTESDYIIPDIPTTEPQQQPY